MAGEAFKLLNELSVEKRRELFGHLNHLRARDEGARVVNENDVEVRADKEIPSVPILIVDENIEHLHADLIETEYFIQLVSSNFSLVAFPETRVTAFLDGLIGGRSKDKAVHVRVGVGKGGLIRDPLTTCWSSCLHLRALRQPLRLGPEGLESQRAGGRGRPGSGAKLTLAGPVDTS
jgi:hypothetical protein